MAGDRVFIRTLRGRPAFDVGSECTGPLPQRGITNFDFQQTDGPGRAELIRRPDPGDGRVVIHIRDSESGDHKYTLEFRWDSRGGFDRDGDRRRDEDRDRPRDYDRGDRGDRGDRVQRTIQLCTDAATGQVSSRYGYRRFDIQEARVDDRPGRADFIVGSGTASGGGRPSTFTFFCRVNLDSGELREVNVRPR